MSCPGRVAGLAASVAILFWLCIGFPATAVSACWRIVTPDTSIEASELWQIHNRKTGESTLLGQDGGQERAVSVSRIASIRLSGSSGKKSMTVPVELRLLDGGPPVTLQVRNSFFYRAGDKRHEMPFSKTVSIERCAKAESLSASVPADRSAHAVLVTKNGDQFHGAVLNESLSWKTPWGLVQFDPASLSMVVADCGANETGQLRTVAGDRISGELADSPIVFSLSMGQELSVGASEIAVIDFSEAGISRAEVCPGL